MGTVYGQSRVGHVAEIREDVVGGMQPLPKTGRSSSGLGARRAVGIGRAECLVAEGSLVAMMAVGDEETRCP